MAFLLNAVSFSQFQKIFRQKWWRKFYMDFSMYCFWISLAGPEDLSHINLTMYFMKQQLSRKIRVFCGISVFSCSLVCTEQVWVWNASFLFRHSQYFFWYFLYTSANNLVYLAYDRYRAVIHPLHYKDISKWVTQFSNLFTLPILYILLSSIFLSCHWSRYFTVTF